MNKEIEDFLREMFLGTIILSVGEVQGIHFDYHNDGAVLLNMRCVNQMNSKEDWQYLLISGESMQRIQDRLASVPASAIVLDCAS